MVSGSAAGDEERKRGDVADADEEGILVRYGKTVSV